jgi:hypothetical protein
MAAQMECWTYTNRLVVVAPCLVCDYCSFVADCKALELLAVSVVETVICTLQRMYIWQEMKS